MRAWPDQKLPIGCDEGSDLSAAFASTPRRKRRALGGAGSLSPPGLGSRTYVFLAKCSSKNPRAWARRRIEPVGEATGRSYGRETVANDESPLRREDLGWGRELIPNEA